MVRHTHKHPYLGKETWIKPDGTEEHVQVYGECTAAEHCRMTKRCPKPKSDWKKVSDARY